MEISTIDPAEYRVNVREWPVEAAESRVFEGRDFSGNKVALKVYPTLSYPLIEDYAKVTNFLAEKINTAGLVISLNFGGEKHDYTVRIVPISTTGVVDDPDKKDVVWPCAVTPFIEGPSLFDLDRNFLSRHKGASSENPLYRLSQTLEEMVKRNIAIIPWNVKPMKKDGDWILQVTDLCGSIKSL